MVNKWRIIVQSFLYPPMCTLCGQAGEGGLDLCSGCHGDLPFNHHACQRCALPLAPSASEIGLCGQCLNEPPPFKRAFSLLRYVSPVNHLIPALKFGGALQHARLLGNLMADALIHRDEPLPDCIVPVPLHPSRQRSRGFNQALELARPLGRRLHIPLDVRSCKRVRPTAAQSQLDAKQRRSNVAKAFSLVKKPRGGHVALLDDVVTTGHTVGELAQVLRRGGVETVEVWSVARASY